MIDTFFNIFEKYGWESILGISIIILIYFLGKLGLSKLSKSLSDDMTTGFDKVGEKLTDQMSKQNDKLVDTIVGQQSKLIDHFMSYEQNKEDKHHGKINNRIKITKEVNDMLKIIMHKQGAQRIFIIELHNSYQNLSAIPFAKYTMTYEYFDEGILPLQQNCNGLPFSQIANIIEDIIEEHNQQKIYDDLNKMREENPTLSVLLKSDHVTEVVYNALYDHNNQLFGIACLEYHIPKESIKLDLAKFKIDCAKISLLINLDDFNNYNQEDYKIEQ